MKPYPCLKADGLNGLGDTTTIPMANRIKGKNIKEFNSSGGTFYPLFCIRLKDKFICLKNPIWNQGISKQDFAKPESATLKVGLIRNLSTNYIDRTSGSKILSIQ